MRTLNKIICSVLSLVLILTTLLTCLPIKVNAATNTDTDHLGRNTWTFTYSGGIQSITLPAGVYTLEVWGASGGTAKQSIGGNGGYSRGEISFYTDQTLFIGVGGVGANLQLTNIQAQGGYNGGGTVTGGNADHSGGGGGGATHIATQGNALYSLAAVQSAVLIVAGGGGGGDASSTRPGGVGGGNDGGTNGYAGTGGTQTNGGIAGGTGGTNGSFGLGGSSPYNLGGGGGGWFGGSTGSDGLAPGNRLLSNPGGGGSGYVGGVTNGITIAGDLSMPNPDLTSGPDDPSGVNMVGRQGHGIARITALGPVEAEPRVTILTNPASMPRGIAWGDSTSGTNIPQYIPKHVSPGETVQLGANPSPTGYTFSHWSVDAGGVTLSPTSTFTMPNNNVTITAHYTADITTPPLVKIRTNPAGMPSGTASGNSLPSMINIPQDQARHVPLNEKVYLNAIDNPTGYTFSHWTVDAGGVTLLPAANTHNPEFTMPGNDVTLTAHYTPVTAWNPTYTVLVLDVSNSVNLLPMKTAAINRATALLKQDPDCHISIVSFATTAGQEFITGAANNFSNRLSDIVNTINNTMTNASSRGTGSNIREGLNEAKNALSLVTATTDSKVILYSDGLPNQPDTGIKSPYNMSDYALWRQANAAYEKAVELCNTGYTIETVYISGSADPKKFGSLLMKDIACGSPGLSHSADCAGDTPFSGITRPTYQRVIIECPVDVTINHDNATLSSDKSSRDYNNATSWGKIDYSGPNADIKTVSLYEDIPFDIQLTGNGTGSMDYTVAFYDDNTNLTQEYSVKNVPITAYTRIRTNTDRSTPLVLLYDQHGDGLVTEMSIPAAYPANSAPETFPINVRAAGGNAAGYGSSPNQAEQGAVVSLNAGLNPGYTFVNWTSSPPVVFTDNTDPNATFIMPGEAVTVTANFLPIPQATYAVTVSSAGTGATGDGHYTQDDPVSIYAGTPPEGQQFSHWTASPALSFNNANNADTRFIMPAHALTVTAHFEPVTAESYEASVEPSAKTFTARRPGYNSTSMTQVFTITNTGTMPITNLSATLLNDYLDGSGFKITEGLSDKTINPGDTATVSIRPLDGLDAGIYNDALIIMGDNNIDFVADLSFTVSEDSIHTADISPAGKTFAPAQEGYDNSHMAQLFTIENIGTEPVTGLSASLDGDDFEINIDLSDMDITSGGALDISIRPVNGLEASDIPYTDTLTITGDRNVLLTAPLSFRVIAIPTRAAAVDPIEKTYAPANAGYSNTDMEQLFIISSTGTGQITGLTASLNGIDFEISTALSASSIHAGEAVIIGIRPANGLAASGMPYTDSLLITGDNGVSLTVPLRFVVNGGINNILYGDLNGDRIVNTTDLILMMKYFSQPGMAMDTSAADVNGDGAINMADLIIFLRYFSQPGVVLGPPTREDYFQ